MTRAHAAKAASYLPFYVLCIALASALWQVPGVLTTCYVVLGGGMLLRWHTRSDLAYFFLAFVLGPAGELVATHYGAWQYTKPAFLIPLWLPLAWGISGLFFKRAAEALSGAGTVEPRAERLTHPALVQERPAGS